MAGQYEQEWNDAKKAFEKATGRKKPGSGFMGLFASGLTPACRELDKTVDKDAAAMEKAFDKYVKDATSYKKELATAEKDDSANYKGELAKLIACIDDIADDSKKKLEQKLPTSVRLPNSISESKNVFRRCKSDVLKPAAIAFSIGFTEKSVRVTKLVEEEVDGLIQTLIMRCSNIIRDLEEELAATITTQEKFIKTLKDDKEIEKAKAEAEKLCTGILQKRRAEADSTVDKLCGDWFKKHELAKEYKKGFIKSVIMGVVSIAVGVTAAVLTGGTALIPILMAAGKNLAKLGALCYSGYKYFRGIETTEAKIKKTHTDLVKMYTEGKRSKIEVTEFASKFGAFWLDGIDDLEELYKEYGKKCTDYDDKYVNPVKKQFSSIYNEIVSASKSDPKTAKTLDAKFTTIFDCLAEENKNNEQRADLRISVGEDIEVMKGKRRGVLKLYSVYETGSQLNEIGGILKELAGVMAKIAG
jgi:hypothetical protein